MLIPGKSCVCVCVCLCVLVGHSWCMPVRVCACVCSRFSFDKTPVFRGIISPFPDSNMLCIYGGNKLIHNRQTNRQLAKGCYWKLCPPYLYLGIDERGMESNIFRDSQTCCATPRASYHPVNFDMALTFMRWLTCHATVCGVVLPLLKSQSANVQQLPSVSTQCGTTQDISMQTQK